MTRWVSLIESRQEIELSTVFDYPPIPIRDFDWHALDANTYDTSYEGEDENGSIWSVSGFMGTGRTENEAIASLFDQLQEAA